MADINKKRLKKHHLNPQSKAISTTINIVKPLKDVVLLLLCHMLWIAGGEGWLLDITMKLVMLWVTWLAWDIRM